MKDQKVDDEDGHYIVVPEADLTERCGCHYCLLTFVDTDRYHRPNPKTSRTGNFRKGRGSLGQEEADKVCHQGHPIRPKVSRRFSHRAKGPVDIGVK